MALIIHSGGAVRAVSGEPLAQHHQQPVHQFESFINNAAWLSLLARSLSCHQCYLSLLCLISRACTFRSQAMVVRPIASCSSANRSGYALWINRMCLTVDNVVR